MQNALLLFMKICSPRQAGVPCESTLPPQSRSCARELATFCGLLTSSFPPSSMTPEGRRGNRSQSTKRVDQVHLTSVVRQEKEYQQGSSSNTLCSIQGGLNQQQAETFKLLHSLFCGFGGDKSLQLVDQAAEFQFESKFEQLQAIWPSLSGLTRALSHSPISGLTI